MYIGLIVGPPNKDAKGLPSQPSSGFVPRYLMPLPVERPRRYACVCSAAQHGWQAVQSEARQRQLLTDRAG